MIPIGEKCKECGKIHIVKSMEEFEKLSPRIRTQAYKSEHRIFKLGYYMSLDINDGEIWEIYLPLSTLTIEIQEVQEDEIEENLEAEYARLQIDDEDDYED